MSSPATSFPPARVVPQLGHAFGGIWRLTFRRLLQPMHWLIVAGLLVVFGALARGEAIHSQNLPGWSSQVWLSFLAPVLAFIAAGGAMRDEMKSATVDYVLTRPVPRWAFVVFKYLSHVICAELDFLLAFGVLAVLTKFYPAWGLKGYLVPLFAAQVLVVAAFSALGFLCAVFSARYVVIGLVYGFIVEVTLGRIATQVSRLSMTHQARAMLGFPGETLDPSAGTASPVVAGLLLLAFTVVMVGAAAAVFTWREQGSASES